MKKILLSSAVVIGLSAMGASFAYADGRPQGGPQGEPQGPSFEQIDANGDGALTMEEIQGQANAKFEETDTNGDGQLDIDELMAAAEQQRGRMVERMMAQKDTNDDGMLSMEEMAPRDPGRFFEKADADGNGEISQEEWDAAMDHMRGHGGQRGHDRNGRHGGKSGN